MLEEIVDILNITEKCEINFPDKNLELDCNRIALEQIFLNLINNSLKYNDKNEIIIDIECIEDNYFYHFTVTDNGLGIPQDKQEFIFDFFSPQPKPTKKE